MNQQQISEILQLYSHLSRDCRIALKNLLKNCEINTVPIRTTLLQQNSSNKNGILILDGVLLLTHKQIFIAQLNNMQIANIQVFLYDNVRYTVNVESSFVKYIQIKQQLLKKIYEQMQELVKRREKQRGVVIKTKEQQEKRRKKIQMNQKVVNRLSLPVLKFISESPRKGDLLVKRIDFDNRGIRQKSLDIQNQKIISLRNVPTQLKKVQLIIRQKPESSKIADRNQKIFKQHLKSIIKRKLLYERRQLGVLKSTTPQPNYSPEYPNTYNSEKKNNEIDDYFRT